MICDGFSFYKQSVAQGITEVGGLAHVRRKFFDLHAGHKRWVAHAALEQFGLVYEIEREVRECSAEERQSVRQDAQNR